MKNGHPWTSTGKRRHAPDAIQKGLIVVGPSARDKARAKLRKNYDVKIRNGTSIMEIATEIAKVKGMAKPQTMGKATEIVANFVFGLEIERKREGPPPLVPWVPSTQMQQNIARAREYREQFPQESDGTGRR